MEAHNTFSAAPSGALGSPNTTTIIQADEPMVDVNAHMFERKRSLTKG
jgi:hypothetical protein